MSTFHGKRKPFQGKQKHKDLREFKNQEIRKSLVHRARLRKNYFKLVENEGAPTDFERLTKEYEGREDKDAGEEESQEEKDSNQTEDPEESVEDEKVTARQKKALPPQSSIPKEQRVVKEKRKPLNFAERAQLAKERKMQNKEAQLRKVQEKRRNLETSQKEREKKKLSLSQRTKSGQPVMGPKINDLLNKIRRNETI